jgi:excisionase family DNA binding protein
MTISDETLLIKPAAKYLGIHPDTLQQRAAAGIVRGCKPGKCWVFKKTDLDAYLDALCHVTPQQARQAVIEPIDVRAMVRQIIEKQRQENPSAFLLDTKPRKPMGARVRGARSRPTD